VVAGARRLHHPAEQLLAARAGDAHVLHHGVCHAMRGQALRVRQARRTQATEDGAVHKPAQPPSTHGRG